MPAIATRPRKRLEQFLVMSDALGDLVCCGHHLIVPAGAPVCLDFVVFGVRQVCRIASAGS